MTGNCVFLHHYVLNGMARVGHSVWNSGKLALFDSCSWLSRHAIVSTTDIRGPGGITHMPQLATFAFAHVVRAVTDIDFAELVVGIQTMYSSQIVNGAAHLPIRPHVIARVYSTPPYIIEIVR